MPSLLKVPGLQADTTMPSITVSFNVAVFFGAQCSSLVKQCVVSSLQMKHGREEGFVTWPESRTFSPYSVISNSPRIVGESSFSDMFSSYETVNENQELLHLEGF